MAQLRDMRRVLISVLLALVIMAPSEAMCQDEVRRSELTVTLDGTRYFLHTVARGETLYSIAKAYGAVEAAILDRNPFVARGLRVGQTLLIAPSSDLIPEKPKIENAKPVAPPTVAPELHNHETTSRPTVQYREPQKESGEVMELGLTKEINSNQPLHIAMLLPFGAGRSDATFVDFYRGSLLALAALKESGARVELDVLSTTGSTQSVDNIINDGVLRDANLIIGPVYDAPFEVVARYASAHSVPIVSPLGGTGFADSPYVIAAAADEAAKWDKLRPMLSDPESNVILIEHGQFADTAVLLELNTVLPSTVRRLTYNGKLTPVAELSDMLDRDRQNIVVVAISNENAVEQILARLSSINSAGRYKIAVVGTSRWARFSTMDMELLFKLSATYPASYFMDRSDSRVAKFYRDYIEAFGSVPTLFSFRGYDVTKTFASLLLQYGSRALLELEGYVPEVLQTPYRYVQRSSQGKFTNVDWAVVTYHPNYTITVN